MPDDESVDKTPQAVVEKQPWEPPRLVPLDVASTETADFPTGFDVDGGPTSGGN